MGNRYFAHLQAQTGNHDEEPEDAERKIKKHNNKAEKDFMGHQQKDLCLQITFLLSGTYSAVSIKTLPQVSMG